MMNFHIFLIVMGLLLSTSARAIPVEYQFTGEVTADLNEVFNVKHFVDAPFTLSIFADTDNTSYAGYIAGAGSGSLNNSTSAIWSVNGLGNATSFNTQIYSLPGLAQIGFGWNGQVFPLNTNEPARTILYFNANEIATDPNYSHLSNPVAPISVFLQTSLRIANSLPEYSTYIYFDGIGELNLKALSNVSYSVISIPEPSNLALLLAGLGVIYTVSVRRHRVEGVNNFV